MNTPTSLLSPVLAPVVGVLGLGVAGVGALPVAAGLGLADRLHRQGLAVAAPDDLVVVGALVGLGAVLGWLGLCLALGAVAAVPGPVGRACSGAAAHICPALLRSAVAALLSTALGTGLVTAASAAERPQPTRTHLSARGSATAPVSAASASAAVSAALAVSAADTSLPPAGWTPAPPAPPRRTDTGVHLVSSAPGAGRDVDEEVVVRRGDTLWSIAARHLGPHAGAREVARSWPRWAAANRSVIGPDPDRIVPGQRLRPPGARHAAGGPR